jgi:hypothetical protein
MTSDREDAERRAVRRAQEEWDDIVASLQRIADGEHERICHTLRDQLLRLNTEPAKIIDVSPKRDVVELKVQKAISLVKPAGRTGVQGDDGFVELPRPQDRNT